MNRWLVRVNCCSVMVYQVRKVRSDHCLDFQIGQAAESRLTTRSVLALFEHSANWPNVAHYESSQCDCFGGSWLLVESSTDRSWPIGQVNMAQYLIYDSAQCNSISLAASSATIVGNSFITDCIAWVQVARHCGWSDLLGPTMRAAEVAIIELALEPFHSERMPPHTDTP